MREQYKDTSNFDARVALHAAYSTSSEQWTTWVFDRLDLGDSADILEVGCGPAWLWRENSDRVPDAWRIVASDMSLGMAVEAKRELLAASFLVTDAQALPFADGRFDAVIANHMLYHVPDLDRALSEFVRVLRPGGKLYAATNGQGHFREVRDILETHWRYIGIFGLENGPEKVGRHFGGVSVERYDDALEVPSAEPVLAYVKSMSNFWNLDADREARLRRFVVESIERRGTFHITKDAGLITGTRP